jgi:hypothetical protein
MCAIAIFSMNNTCWKKKLPLSNGRFIRTYRGKVLLKVRNDKSTLFGPSFSNPGKNQHFLILAGSVLLGCSMFVIFILIGAICHGFFYEKRVSKIDRNGSFSEMNFVALHTKSFKRQDGFKEELGRGAFGIVYKGAIKMGSNVLHVLVKKLSSAAQEKETEFKAEVEIIGKTHKESGKTDWIL